MLLQRKSKSTSWPCIAYICDVTLIVSIATGLSKFAWLARSVARNRAALFPPTAPAAAAAGCTGNDGGDGGAVMTSAPTACDATHDDIPFQTSSVRHRCFITLAASNRKRTVM